MIARSLGKAFAYGLELVEEVHQRVADSLGIVLRDEPARLGCQNLRCRRAVFRSGSLDQGAVVGVPFHKSVVLRIDIFEAPVEARENVVSLVEITLLAGDAVVVAVAAGRQQQRGDGRQYQVYLFHCDVLFVNLLRRCRAANRCRR